MCVGIPKVTEHMYMAIIDQALINTNTITILHKGILTHILGKKVINEMSILPLHRTIKAIIVPQVSIIQTAYLITATHSNSKNNHMVKNPKKDSGIKKNFDRRYFSVLLLS